MRRHHLVLPEVLHISAKPDHPVPAIYYQRVGPRPFAGAERTQAGRPLAVAIADELAGSNVINHGSSITGQGTGLGEEPVPHPHAGSAADPLRKPDWPGSRV